MDKIGIGSKNEKWLLASLIIIQLAVAVFFGFQKESWHLDELYTQGLSNSFYKPYIDSSDLMEWKSNEFYEDYLTVQDDERFAYGSVFYNQSQDVHPPFFYVLIHTISSFTPDHFSKWYGIGLNLIFFIGIQLILYALARAYTKNGSISLLVCAAYGFSAGAIGNIMFLRMYVMLTFFVVLFAWIHSEMIRKNKLDVKLLLGVFLVCIAGFLTQYLFLVFAFFGFLAFGFQLLRQGKRKEMLLYSGVLFSALVCATMIFPAWVQLFIQGGIKANPVYETWISASYFVKVLFFLYYLLRGLFGSVYVAIALGFLALSIKLYRIKVQKQKPRAGIMQILSGIGMPAWVLWTSIGSCLMIIYISPFNDAYRYLSFLVPLWILYLIPAVHLSLKRLRFTSAHPGIVVGLLIAVLASYSYASGSVDYLYKNRADNLDARMALVANYPAICISSNNINMTIAVPLLEQHGKSCYVAPINPGADAKRMLEEIGKLGTPVVVYLPDWIKEEHGTNADEYIQEISKICGYEQCIKIVDAEESGLLTSAYLMK